MFFEIPFRRPRDFPEVEVVDDIFLSGSKGYQCRCSPLLLLLVGTGSLHSSQGIGGSTVWFCQNEGIPLTLDSLLFDCAMMKCFFVTGNSTQCTDKMLIKSELISKLKH